MSTDERKEQPQTPAAPIEQPAPIQDLSQKPISKADEEKVKGGALYTGHWD